MCLSVVDEVYKPFIKAERYAYKVFTPHPSFSGYYFDSRIHNGNWSVPTGHWIKCYGSFLIEAHDDSSYPCGFHSFATLKGARFWRGDLGGSIIVRVRIRGLKAAGRQGGFKVLIAREMFVPNPT